MSLAEDLKEIIYVAPYVGHDAYLKPTFGAARQVKAMVAGKMQLVRNAQGEEVVSDRQLLVAEEIGLRDAVWLPGEDYTDITKARQPKAVAYATDQLSGERVWKVWL